MKTTVASLRLLCLVGVLAALAACEDEKKDDTVAPTPTRISVDQIIVYPRVASPGDTVALSADVRSSSRNVGDIPSYSWSATGGTFVIADAQTAQWVAPGTPGMYTVTARVQNSVNTVSEDKTVLVGTQTTLIAGGAGEVTLQANGVDFYYLHTQDLGGSNPTSNGVEVARYAGGVGVDAVSPTRSNGMQLVYASDLSLEVHAEDVGDSVLYPKSNPKPRHIYTGNLMTGTPQRISQDLAAFNALRHNVFEHPAVSPDGQLIAYQGLITGQPPSPQDSIDIFVYRPAGPNRIRVTLTHPNHKNFFPTFSSDQQWLTFVSDRDANNRWELYGIPVSGTTVDTNPASVVRLTDTGGIIAGNLGGGFPAFPLKRWNPVAPTLAILGSDNTVYLVTTSGSGASTVSVTGLPPSIQSLVWSADGNQLAVVATGKDANDLAMMQIYLVNGSSAQLLYQAAVGDLVSDLAFSPDRAWMVFRITRGDSWLELVDLSAGVLTATLSITPAMAAGNADVYRSRMSLSPAWGTGNILYAPVFNNTQSTPAIISVDLSSVIQ